MDRVITVRGTAKLTVQPDFITVVIQLEERDKDYEKAVTGLFDRVNAISRCVKISGLPQESIQTDDFTVRIDRRLKDIGIRDLEEMDDGYVAMQSISIGFSKNMAALVKLIQAVSREIAKPDIQIHYSVKDTSKVAAKLLQRLSEDAHNKAKTICEASGVVLGKLMNVNYQWNNLNTMPVVPQSVSFGETARFPTMATMAPSVPSFTPKGIDLEEDAVFVWEIVDKNRIADGKKLGAR